MYYSEGAWTLESNEVNARDVDAGWATITPRTQRDEGDDADCIVLSDSDLLDVESAG